MKTIQKTIARGGAVLAIAMMMPYGAPAAAQEPVAQDSILAILRDLQRRVDSLQGVIEELRTAGTVAATEEEELAALRAAASRAAAQASEPPTETGQSRTGSLQALNPEISVTGDIVGGWLAPGGEANEINAVAREFEFSFQSALDPYTRTKIFVTKHEDFEVAGFEPPGHGHGTLDPATGEPAEAEGEPPFEIEEGYMYWVGLPGGFGFKVGKFRQDMGLYNRWHTHALLEVDPPLALTAFTGEDGLVQTGASVSLPTFTFGPATQSLVFEVTRQGNEIVFEEGGDLSYLGRFQNFWDLGASAYLQFGGTGVYGSNDELTARMLGVDAAFRWAPGGNARYREFSLKGEWFFAEREEAVDTETGNGGYVQANYRADRRWVLGARADIVEDFDDEKIFQFAPSLSWWQSEFVRLRLQYNYLKPRGELGNSTLMLQFVWAMGPHKHETY